MTKLGPGMAALQAKVADKIIKCRAKDRTSVKLFRMLPEFNLAAYNAANKSGLSYESWIRVAMAEKMNWEGEI